MYSCSKCCDHGLDLCISIDFIQPCFLYIEDFSSQRKDSLRRAGLSPVLAEPPAESPSTI